MSVSIRESDLEKKYALMTEGGEAKIYEYDGKNLIKIYKENVMLDLKEKKVEAWLKAAKIPFVVSPLDNVKISNKFAGYMLEKVQNAETDRKAHV